MTQLIVATRSAHKLREIRDMLPTIPGLEVVDLQRAGIAPREEEEALEVFSTFEANALAKARYFAARSALPVLADDSGLCVDALDGAPGVLSKRFAGREDLSGSALDRANNDRLLAALDRANNDRLLAALDLVDDDRRSAHYVCVIAIVAPDGREELFRGTVEGFILRRPRGEGGFGYDPLFFVPSLGATFAEVPTSEKNRLSHRARALEAAIPDLRKMAGASP